MTMTETYTPAGWVDTCRHQVDEETAGTVEQLGLEFVDRPADSAHYTVARCVRCGEWVSLANSQETLI